MADSTLDDLILTDPEPEKGKSKGLLALLALIVLLIIVGAILAKMIFSSSENNATEVNNSKEPTVQTTVDNNQQNSSSAAENLDIKDPDLAPLDDMNGTMDATLQADSIDGGVVEDGAPGAAKTAAAEKKSAKQKSIEKAQKEAKAPEKTAPKASQEKKEPVHNEVPKKEVVQHKPKPQPTHKTYGGSGNVYIQVGSFVRGPESSFIEKIRRAGFKFRIKEQNGKRRVYVGPFRSRQEASSLLGKVKAEINPNAFIK